MLSSSDTVWYFAYGSNMSSAKFTGDRGIIPLKVARVRIPGWILAMEIPGMPYSEPSFSSIAPRAYGDGEEKGFPDVVGVAYLITRAQYKHVIASEGGGTAYLNLCIAGVPVEATDEEKTGTRVKVWTLGSAIARHPPPAPSLRYMTLLTEGANESKLPLEYQGYLSQIPTYRLPDSRWTRLGATIFLSIWSPVMSLMEKLVKGNIREDGNTYLWIVYLVRLVMLFIWLMHDYVFWPMFGRGDGL
ncbi:hypothetical protein F5B22DRAFT_638650 [Xylaria bambusicola]|uniref:uncharacterized protein n=1 Tax=Xylaria bambusicola TaxID=326684 RepID=UPI0020075006|nr:uncharacterized protein F5B22DRAFT_638650 [Xylaria bambusicola]KAI0508615.1 hypothetical protein F5B22DRAFT_638650 [Xylaria bambusicola]